MLDVEAITQATATLRSLINAGPRAWDGAPEEEVVAALGAAADLARTCDSVKIAAAGAVARRSEPLTPIESLARRLGHSNTRRLVMDVFGVNGYVAGSWIDVAAAVQPRTGISTGDLPPARPAVAAAIEAGELSAEIAKAIVEQLSKLTGESVDGGIAVAEAAMVANATGGRINLFKPAPPVQPAPPAGQSGGYCESGTDWGGNSSGPGGPGDGILEFLPQNPPAPQDPRMTPWGEMGGTPWDRDPRYEDPHTRAGRAWFGHQDDPGQPHPGQASAGASGAGNLGRFGQPGAHGNAWPAVPGAPAGHEQDGTPGGGGAGWPGTTASPNQQPSPHQRQQPQAPFRPVLPPSMDENTTRSGTGSAIAGGRVGLERIKEESKGWGLVLDPDGAEPRYEQQRKNRSFRLIKKAGGGYDITGFAPDVEGAQIRTLLDACLSPRTKDHGPENLFNQDHEANSTDMGTGTGADESRTHAQRSFDALAHILALHAASADAPTTAGAAPTLLISTTLTAIDHHLHDCATHDAHGSNPAGKQADGTSTGIGGGSGMVNGSGLGTGAGAGGQLGGVTDGWWPQGIHQIPLNALGVPDPDAMIDLRLARVGGDGTPVPLSAVMHLLCDAALQVMLTDPTGVPLKLGRAQRLFTKDQRRVLIARDHHCRAPGCDIPGQWCEVHHVIPWQDGGKTNVTNAILLCNFHHHEIDRGRLKVTHHPGTHVRFEHKYTVEPTWAPPHRAHYRPTG
ncbi:HNH endonuclease signature motif containing protein [Galactobacter valiniphilus]|uniref:HNH endonuclease signature motif containing protein n=1 Tax=Galactobacter valiniphilus TaxID=2676122 RepID=UPI0037358DC3